MKKILLSLTLAFLSLYVPAQQTITYDPAKDQIARRGVDGALQWEIDTRVLVVAIQESIPQISEIDSIALQKIGKSNYIVARGRDRSAPLNKRTVAILLAETAPNAFQADELVVSCSSSGNCRECSLPPLCHCSSGEGNCSQQASLLKMLQKVTVTLTE